MWSGSGVTPWGQTFGAIVANVADLRWDLRNGYGMHGVVGNIPIDI